MKRSWGEKERGDGEMTTLELTLNLQLLGATAVAGMDTER